MPKSSRSSEDLNLKSKSSPLNCNLTLQDVICPICFSIMIEPVVMPCNHALCLPCFEENVAKSALACPFCRKRLSIWLRNATRKKCLVHQGLWEWIKQNFTERVQNRINGNDDLDDSDFESNASLQISAPGEIKQEFSLQLKQIQEEDAKRREKEERESLLLISKMQNEDIQLSRSQKKDSLPTQRLNRLSKVPKKPSTKRHSPFFPMASSTPKQLSLDCFLTRPLKRTCLQDITSFNSSDSEDSQEDYIEKIEEKSFQNGLNKENDSVITDDQTVAAQDRKCCKELSTQLFSSYIEIEGGEDDDESSCLSENKTSILRTESHPVDETQALIAAISGSGSGDNKDFINELIAEQKKLEEKLKQEKEDELLARQMEAEMKKVNRCKGTADEYCLRNKSPNLSSPSTSKSSVSSKRPREIDKRAAASTPFEKLPKSPRL